MKKIQKIVECLAQGNKNLTSDVLSEIKELLVDETEGQWHVNSHNALRFAFEIDKVTAEKPLPSQMETHQLLLKSGANSTLINKIFAQRGINA